MNSLHLFKSESFIQALKAFFKELNVPLNFLDDEPASAADILADKFKSNNDAHQLITDVYALGIIDDAIFKNEHTFSNLDAVQKLEADYDGILVFGICLKDRENGLLPTRSQLAEISRAFNRAFPYTPVTIVFKYGSFISFSNSERVKYKQEWREGEKAGKVSLLRDINFQRIHTGHIQILNSLKISRSGSKQIDSFTKLYSYWQEVFSVSLLSKKFYQELSNWYFWATKYVSFPSEPTVNDAHLKNIKLEELVQEHKATNVIRMLTRLLFVWFIKEKNLIPEELFDLEKLQKDILFEISPVHEEGMFKERNKESIYYKAILQNLFFATLNCPIESEGTDKRKRGFRAEGYGTNRGIDYLMRYKQYFKNPEAFVELMNSTVPFLNGGLFECLDDKLKNQYIDGFSDGMPENKKLIVPDFLFFGTTEETDISDIIGINDSKNKKAAVKGLINILKSYKFTVTENTPIEEDVALDPELLGKVFENLLASYNPETKTTARKQTGSFYTPREIVNYMVDESLIAYLKNKILENNNPVFFDLGFQQAKLFGNEHTEGQLSLMTEEGGAEFKNNEALLDERLHQLVSYDPGNPFEVYPEAQKIILKELGECKILDPACGSGAFPMGVLQKMVHILHKLDPDNKNWKELQLEKARKESDVAFDIEDKQAREERLMEINEAFDQNTNDPDYARKLFLIENCIYGVDIQPIAVQISKLRFFISLVVEQKVNSKKKNFGIRALPNLETKFVAANTLIGIEKPDSQLKLFDTAEVALLEKELKQVRHKLFNAKTKETKLKYRQKDEELRNKIALVLEKNGWPAKTASMLSSWDPYNQNVSSPFFDPEWMFDVREGFDVVIGNPPYGAKMKNTEKDYYRLMFTDLEFKIDSYEVFILNSNLIMNESGLTTFIVPSGLMDNFYSKKIRVNLLNRQIIDIVELDDKVFDGAVVHSMIITWSKNKIEGCKIKCKIGTIDRVKEFRTISNFFLSEEGSAFSLRKVKFQEIITLLNKNSIPLQEVLKIKDGIDTGDNERYTSNDEIIGWKKLIGGSDISRWSVNSHNFINYGRHLANPRDPILFENPKIVIRETGNKIIATLDQDGYYALSTLYSGFILNSKFNLKSILAILHSSIIHFLMVLIAFGRTEGAFTKTRIFHYYSLPVSLGLLKHQDLIIFFVDAILYSAKRHYGFEKIEIVLDAIIFNLYFPDHMQERGINVMTFVEQNIEAVMQGREFENLSDAEKEQVIEQLQRKWTDPNNEVVKRMSMFKEKSPDILKVILES